MPSHPDRVRRNYIDIKLYTWNSLLERNEKVLITINTLEIASLTSRRDVAQYVAKKVYDGILKPEKINE